MVNPNVVDRPPLVNPGHLPICNILRAIDRGGPHIGRGGPHIESLKTFVKGIVPPRGPFAPPLGVRGAAPLEVFQTFRPKFKFRWVLGPSDQNELYQTPFLSKI